MICDICGEEGAQARRVSRCFGQGADLLVIEGVPLVRCPHCRESYFTAETMQELERIQRNRQTAAIERRIAVAAFAG